jgi:hypothetical protein
VARVIVETVALVLISAQAARAANIVDADFASAIQLGCQGGACTSGSTNATAALLSESVNTYTLRFGLNVNADDSAGPGTVLENGLAQYTTSFTVDGGNYNVSISTNRRGALRRNADAAGCEGSVALGDLPEPTLTINDEPGPDVAVLALPGAAIANGGGDADLEVDSSLKVRIIPMRNRPGPDRFSLTLIMNAAAFSDSCEVSARFGAPNGGTTGCSACEYPGDGARDIEADGLFVTVTVEDLCGDGELQAPEQCDLGNRNGDSDSCCRLDCTFRPNIVICRGSTASPPCDPFELCTGNEAECPPDLKAPQGTACEDDGDPCTEDLCDGSGQCLHTDTPDPCPERCGNGRIDTGENCDLGPEANGLPTTCCDATCQARPDGSSCADDLFCNGNEICGGGVCGVLSGTLCTDLGTCAVCDEANDICDTSACVPTATTTSTAVATQTPTSPGATQTPTSPGATPTPTVTSSTPPAGALPLQPTRDLLIGEIFDGDDDRFETSAGGLVRGTLDLDANGDLRFTSADLLRLPRCAADALLIGGVCIDRYEASVWSNPPGSPSMGTQYGVSDGAYPCTRDGQDCRQRIYARSLAGVVPSAEITWLQAQQACANVGKRLLINAEWQRAVAGTPDTGGADDGSTTCVTNGGTVQETGSRTGCVSKWGTYDMVGNLWEWVADWMPVSDACPGWGSFSDDDMCLAGVDRSATFPAALIRGGGAGFGAAAGPLAVRADFAGPGSFAGVIGFRCARAPF